MTATHLGAPPGIDDVMALSPLQEGLYSRTVLSGPAVDDPYLIGMTADILGPLDIALLKKCAATMLQRHPNLRASFVSRDIPRPVQIVPSRVTLPWRHVTAAPEELEALQAQERGRPFDFERAPAIRFLLIELPQQHWRLVITAHHMVIDGWSLPVFAAELITLYRNGGDADGLLPAPRPYRDYIGWLAGRDQTATQRLWREHLAGLPGPTLLSSALGGAPARGLPGRIELRSDRQCTTRLVEGARARGVTVNSVLQLAWALVLSRLTDRSDVVFGVTVSGRPAELTGVETMIGLFINTVPLRVRLDDDTTVGRQCLELQRTSATLRDHGYLSHAQLRVLGGVGEMFDTLLVYENFPTGGLAGQREISAGNVTFRPAALESLSHFPVTLAAHLADGELVLLVEVIDGALGRTSGAALGRRMLLTAERLLSLWDWPLGDVSVLFDEETAPLHAAERPPEPPGGPRAIPARFAAVAEALPEEVAVSWAGGALTYHQLDSAADRLAALLVDRGAKIEAPVAIRLCRGPQYVVAMLATLKAGAVCVPLEPAMPEERVESILRQTGATIVVDDALLSAGARQSLNGFRPVDVADEHAAYIVFTSGTTGEPKGVTGTHGALSAYADEHIETVLQPAAGRLGRRLRILHAWSFAFDAAWQPLVALLDGHTVHIADQHTQPDAEALVQTLARHRIDMIDTTPSMFAQLNAFGVFDAARLAVLALGGEAVSATTWAAIGARCARSSLVAYNCYGPTETTVEALVAVIADHDEPTIGRPARHTRGYVLDSALRLVPFGATGELYLAGAQLTRGYVGRAGETATRFLADPFGSGGRMYRTGDLVRRRPDGSLQYLGRTDAQVQVRGFRVEPGEIKSTLESHPGVRRAEVVVRRPDTVPQLTAYVVNADDAAAPTVAGLRGLLAARLPHYMMPRRIVVVDQIPLTANGKVDENRLTAIEPVESAAQQPQTATEAALVELLSQTLSCPQPDVTADFVALGLDSIAALASVQAARRRGIALQPRLMLECTTIRELAAAVDSSRGATDHGGPDVADRFGDVIPAPIVSWLYETGQFRRFSQAVLIALPPDLGAEQLLVVLQTVLDRHDMLRARLHADADGYRLSTRPPGSVPAPDILTRVRGRVETTLTGHAGALIDSIDPFAGAMVRALWCDDAQARQGCLLLVVHHLATDVVSWYVLLSALAAAWTQLTQHDDVALPAEHTSYRQWSRLLHNRSASAELDAQRDYWLQQLTGPDPALGARLPDPARDTWASLRVSEACSDVDETRLLLDKLASAEADGGVRAFLLTALTLALTSLRRRRGQPAEGGLLVALEGHGRQDALVAGDRRDVDTSATVGWFTNVFPVRLGAGPDVPDVQTARRAPAAARDLLAAVTNHLAAVPNQGLDYGLLRYHRRDPRLVAARHPQVEFNYLGRLDGSVTAQQGVPWTMIADPALTTLLPLATEPNLPLRYTFDVVAALQPTAAGPQLRVSWIWSESLIAEHEADEVVQLWRDAVAALMQAL